MLITQKAYDIIVLRYSHSAKAVNSFFIKNDDLNEWIKRHVTGEPKFIDHIPTVVDQNNELCIIKGRIIMPQKVVVEKWEV